MKKNQKNIKTHSSHPLFFPSPSLLTREGGIACTVTRDLLEFGHVLLGLFFILALVGAR